MPWFPDFVAAVELARRDDATTARADPVARYLTALTTGDPHAIERAWPGEIVVLDPYAGEVHGHRALQHFVHTSRAFLAEHLLTVDRVASTAVAGRAVVELLAQLRSADGPVPWPVAVVAEWARDRTIVFRTYGSQLPVAGRRPVRAPILDVDPSAAPGDVVAHHLAALDLGDRDGIVRTFAADGYLQEPVGPDGTHRGTHALEEYFRRFGDAGCTLEPCRVTDDGRRCALEFSCARWCGSTIPPQAGLVVFERDTEGLLAAARYYDDIEVPVTR